MLALLAQLALLVLMEQRELRVLPVRTAPRGQRVQLAVVVVAQTLIPQ